MREECHLSSVHERTAVGWFCCFKVAATLLETSGTQALAMAMESSSWYGVDM